LIPLIKGNAIKQQEQEFDEALRATHSLIQSALEEDPHFVHYSGGESVDTGWWGLSSSSSLPSANGGSALHESLSDQVEIALVTFLQKHPNSIFREIEEELYPRFPGLLTPSQGMIYAVLSSYANKESGTWNLRAEDVASVRRNELNQIARLIDTIGTRLGFATRKQEKSYVWEQNGVVERSFSILASALLGRALAETTHPPQRTVIVLPGGRAALAAYKTQRDPVLAAHIKAVQVVKYRLLRTLVELPVLTRETFEEQVAGDPLEKSKSQMMLF
jgi:hypothetical protein